MSCVLRAWGEAFQVASFFEKSPLQPDDVYEKGVSAAADSGENSGPRVSGFNLTVSEAGLEKLDVQIVEAILFLDQHEDELRRLGSFPGVEGVSLDFVIHWRKVEALSYIFPSDLLWRAGALDISLQITHYPLDEATG